jgi:hypothetical protein
MSWTFLPGQLADMEAGWSVGTFYAIAESARDPGEPAELLKTRDGISVVTGKGGLHITPQRDMRLIAS